MLVPKHLVTEKEKPNSPLRAIRTTGCRATSDEPTILTEGIIGHEPIVVLSERSEPCGVADGDSGGVRCVHRGALTVQTA